MNRIEIKDFSIKIDKDKVLKTLGCFEGSSVYETVSSYFDELEETVMNFHHSSNGIITSKPN